MASSAAAGTSSSAAEGSGLSDLVPFRIEENGMVYEGNIDRASQLRMEREPDFRNFVLINLKSAGIQPSMSVSQAQSEIRATQTTPTMSAPSQTAHAVHTRAKGKTGAIWDKESADEFIQACMPHKIILRNEENKKIDKSVWIDVSDSLFYKKQLDFSFEQCREKMRNLKRALKDFRLGKQKSFDHLDLMVKLLEAPIIDETIDQAQSVLNVQNQTEQGIQKGYENCQSAHQFQFQNLSNCTEESTSSPFLEESSDYTLGDLGFDESIPNQDSDFGSIIEHEEASDIMSENFPHQTVATDSGNKQSGGNKPVNAVLAAKSKKGATGSVSGGGWDKIKTTALVEELTKHKKEVQQCSEIPARIFKEISDDLKGKGLSMTAAACKEKFSQLNDFFVSVLPSGGIRSGFKWPWYEEFCNIHDIPFDFILPESFSSVITYEPVGNQIWTEDAVNLLILEYKLRKPQFDNTKSPIRHQLLFGDIADTMKNFLIPVNSKQCADQMSTMKLKFRQEYDRLNIRNTGQPPTTWPFYEKMLDMFKGCPSLNAPFLVSAGKKVTYSIGGKQHTSSSSGTRTRPRPPTNDELSKKPKPMTAQEYKERVCSQREDLTGELKNLRETFEKTSQSRSADLRDLKDIIKEALLRK